MFCCCLYYISIIKLLGACVLIWMESIYYFYCVKIIWCLIEFLMLTFQITKDRKIVLFFCFLNFFFQSIWPWGIQILLEGYKYRNKNQLMQTDTGREEVIWCGVVWCSGKGQTGLCMSQGLILALLPVGCVTLVEGHFFLSHSFIHSFLQEIATVVYCGPTRG